jgi:hypothetical protein
MFMYSAMQAGTCYYFTYHISPVTIILLAAPPKIRGTNVARRATMQTIAYTSGDSD